MESANCYRVENAGIENYWTSLAEPYRPPSRGGNTTALHRHTLRIDGKDYHFLARGSRQWVYKQDKVSFEYIISKGKYLDIVKETLITTNANGNVVIRGDRRNKPMLRTAPARMPASRREQCDR